MPLPFTLGSGIYEPRSEDFARAMRRMLPDGYPQTDDSLFFYELQDRSLLGVAGVGATELANGSHPLGPHLLQHNHDASPSIPARLSHHGIVQAQQRDAVGWSRRYFATSLANNAFITLDSSIDWRDRIVRACCRWSDSIDILPGHAGDTAANSTAAVTRAHVARYTGTGGHATVGEGLDRGYHLVLIGDVLIGDVTSEDTGLCLHADATTGALTLRNKTANTLYVTGWVDGSFRLGLRRLD